MGQFGGGGGCGGRNRVAGQSVIGDQVTGLTLAHTLPIEIVDTLRVGCCLVALVRRMTLVVKHCKWYTLRAIESIHNQSTNLLTGKTLTGGRQVVTHRASTLSIDAWYDILAVGVPIPLVALVFVQTEVAWFGGCG